MKNKCKKGLCTFPHKFVFDRRVLFRLRSIESMPCMDESLNSHDMEYIQCVHRVTVLFSILSKKIYRISIIYNTFAQRGHVAVCEINMPPPKKFINSSLIDYTLLLKQHNQRPCQNYYNKIVFLFKMIPNLLLYFRHGMCKREGKNDKL